MIELLIKLAIAILTAYANAPDDPPTMTAPTAEERIADLERQVEELKAAPK